MKANKDEFEKFISLYPNKISSDVKLFCSPPLRVFYDFSKGTVEDGNAVIATQCLSDGFMGMVGDQYEIK